MFTVRIDALDNGLALTPPSKSFYVHDHTQLAFDKLQRAPIVPSNIPDLQMFIRLTGTFEF